MIFSFSDVRGWVFDLDGVLVASEPLHMGAWDRVFRRHGIEVSAEWFQKGIGMVDTRFFECVAGAYGLDSADSKFLDEKHEAFQQMIEEHLPIVDGVEALLEKLDGTVSMAVATSSGRKFLDFVLRRNDWHRYFTATFSRDEITSPKPAPEIYLKAAAAIGCDPATCLAIEDTPTGLQAAQAAGLKTIAITTNFPAESLTAADLVIDQYRELLARLNSQ